MSNKELKFWDSVETTDPKYTKNEKVSGQRRTFVDAQHKKKMITGAFGMYGLGWGVIAGSENYERLHFEGSTCILNYQATAFYVYDGQRAEFPIASQIKEAYITSGGKGYLKIDDEAVKKVRTDALTKAFTDLGFCADIHMGKFEDQDYVHGAEMSARLKESEEKEEKQREQHKEIGDWLAKEVESARAISNISGFEKAVLRIKQKAITRCQVGGFASKGFETKLDKAIEDRKNEK